MCYNWFRDWFLMNFIDKDTNTGVVFLCLGSSFLCLSSAHQNGDKNNKEP